MNIVNRFSRRADSIPIARDTDQLPSIAKHTIIVMKRASIAQVMALIIDLDLESMNDHPLFMAHAISRYW